MKVYSGGRENHITIERIWSLIITPHLAGTREPKWVSFPEYPTWRRWYKYDNKEIEAKKIIEKARKVEGLPLPSRLPQGRFASPWCWFHFYLPWKTIIRIFPSLFSSVITASQLDLNYSH